MLSKMLGTLGEGDGAKRMGPGWASAASFQQRHSGPKPSGKLDQSSWACENARSIASTDEVIAGFMMLVQRPKVFLFPFPFLLVGGGGCMYVVGSPDSSLFLFI